MCNTIVCNEYLVIILDFQLILCVPTSNVSASYRFYCWFVVDFLDWWHWLLIIFSSTLTLLGEIKVRLKFTAAKSGQFKCHLLILGIHSIGHNEMINLLLLYHDDVILHSFARLHKFGDLIFNYNNVNSLCGINYFHQIEMKLCKVNLCRLSEFLFSFYHFCPFLLLTFPISFGQKSWVKKFCQHKFNKWTKNLEHH